LALQITANGLQVRLTPDAITVSIKAIRVVTGDLDRDSYIGAVQVIDDR